VTATTSTSAKKHLETTLLVPEMRRKHYAQTVADSKAGKKVAWCSNNIPSEILEAMDITAVAAVYDTGDTSSGNGVNGNPNPVPRCIQSATSRSTAYDLDNVAEPVGDVTVTADGAVLSFDAQLDDADGIASAAVLCPRNACCIWSVSSTRMS